ncbi:SH3 domain-containing protein [Streptomyces sp. S3(2020)]|uniref:SH3 domain-containing protein n=1 Tax=Streptomyces sp. S3(2020) TaxID=2732044 RepID=UPI00148835DA|nr:SH3 domain-containing protein [Streptomyces sp. S3(2020)]NNN35489.1 SH3 domain-containing protein [Streptomyces sp. S3(2020)]
MPASRIAISAAVLGALALPLASATTASAATTIASCPATRPLPYTVHTKAVTLRSEATTKSTALGVLYRSHKFTVHKSSGNWHYLTDKTTGVTGWVSGTYVYRDVAMCLD